MKINILFSYLIKFGWFVIALLIIFLDRNDPTMVIITIASLISLTVVTIIRSLVSRDEWRKLIKDGDVEIKDKIKF